MNENGRQDFTPECPHCGHEYMYPTYHTVWVRDAEDSEHGICVGIRNRAYRTRAVNLSPQSTTSNRMSRCPGRRDVYRVVLMCESCDGKSYLTVEEHKGQIYVDVEKIHRKDELE